MAEVNQNISLIVENSYQACSLGIAVDGVITRSIEYRNQRPSAHLLSWITELLSQESIGINSISSLIVNAGPGAFTSLRVAIVTLNALSFSQQTPIVGVDGLRALLHDAQIQKKSRDTVIVPFLNAYAQEVYFAMYDSSGNELLPATYNKVDQAIKTIQENVSEKHLCLIGNGCEVFAQKIEEFGCSYSIIEQPVPSLDALLSQATLLLQDESYTPKYELYPLYLKSQSFTVR